MNDDEAHNKEPGLRLSDQDFNRKRKTCNQQLISPKKLHITESDRSLEKVGFCWPHNNNVPLIHPMQSPSPPPLKLPSPPPLPPPTQAPPFPLQFPGDAPSPRPTAYPGPSRALRVRRNPTQSPREGKNDTVPAPYPWSTTRRATVHSLDYLVENSLMTIRGEVQCKRCEKQFVVEYDLETKFAQVYKFILENKSSMHDRAPSVWMNPALPACRFCEQENSAKPVIAEKKKGINWLFLLLGQMLGCCTLEQLKYFCKHTKNHRTGAKDRVLYLTYLGLCKQLDPSGPFDRRWD